ncbi:MAG: hypothetical protein WCL08_00265 [Verrucomicrobiota bacterium]
MKTTLLILAVAALALSSCATSYQHPAATASDDEAIKAIFK